MKNFEANFGHGVLRWRWLIIIFTLFAVFLAGSGGKNLEFKTNYRVFFSSDNPQLQAFDALERKYAKNDNVMFVLTPKDGDVFTPQTLNLVEELTEASWQIPYSSRVDSITNFQFTEAEEDDLVVRDLVEDGASFDTFTLEKTKKIALTEPLLVNRLVSPTGHVTGVNVTIRLPGINEAQEVPEVVTFVRNLIPEYEKRYPDVKIRLTGMVMMNNAFSEASKLDMQTLVPLSFLIMLIMIAIMIKGFTGTFGTTLVIIFSIMTAMGLSGFIGFPITPPSASSPTIILTVAIANSVHFLVTLVHLMQQGKTKYDAIVESLRVNLQPIFLASITTSIGFLTMNFSEVPPFQHLGNMVAMGVFASFIFSVTFLPALMSVLPMRVKVVQDGHAKKMAWLGDTIVKNRNKLLIIMPLVVIVLVSFLPKNELNDVFVEYFDKSVEFRQDSDYMAANLTGLYVADYSLESGTSGGISDPAYLKDIGAFADWYRQQPETLHVNVLTDVMLRLNKNMHGDDPAWYKLPESRNLSAQYLLLYEMSLPYGLDLNNQINVDKSATRMTVTLKTISSNEILNLMERAKTWQKNNTTHIQTVEGSGPTVMFANIGQRNIKSMLTGTTLALILISGILIFALRSFKMGVISMIPNLVPAAMGFGLWGLWIGEVGLGLSVVITMTLGIVVDDTVHFLSKYQRAVREKSLDAKDAVRYAFRSVGSALVITSIALTAGFMVLAQSSFELNSGMGLLTAIVIVFALIADFLLLPPLLIKLEEMKNAKKTLPNAATDSANIG